MERLSRNDLVKLLEFFQATYAVRDHEAFISHVLTALRTLIPAEITSPTPNSIPKRGRVACEQAMGSTGQRSVTAIMAGLLPIMWSHGAGADVMKRIAAPMIGGMITSTILTLVIIPVIYDMWRGWAL